MDGAGYRLETNGFRNMGVVTTVRALNPADYLNQAAAEGAYSALARKFPRLIPVRSSSNNFQYLKDQLDVELAKIKPSLCYIGEKLLSFNDTNPIKQIFIDDSHGRLAGIFIHKLLEAAKVPHRAIYVNIPTAQSGKRTCQSYLRSLRDEMARFDGHSVFVTDIASNSAYAVESLYVSCSRVTVISTSFSGRQALFDMRSRWKTGGSWRGIHNQQSLFDRFTEQTSEGGMIARKRGAFEGYQALSQDWLHARRNDNQQTAKELALIAYSRQKVEAMALELAKAKSVKQQS